MISKELFYSVIDKIQKQDIKINNFTNALGKICDGYPIFDADNLYLSALLEVLHFEMNDTDEFIDWWLWEGVEKKVGIKTEDGYVWYLIDTPERLYDYLNKDYKNLPVVKGDVS